MTFYFFFRYRTGEDLDLIVKYFLITGKEDFFTLTTV